MEKPAIENPLLEIGELSLKGKKTCYFISCVFPPTNILIYIFFKSHHAYINMCIMQFFASLFHTDMFWEAVFTTNLIRFLFIIILLYIPACGDSCFIPQCLTERTDMVSGGASDVLCSPLTGWTYSAESSLLSFIPVYGTAASRCYV